MNKVQAVARVQLTVEFAVGGQVWGADCSIEQVHKQAREVALDLLRRGLIIEGVAIGEPSGKTFASVVGEPSVAAILVEAQS